MEFGLVLPLAMALLAGVFDWSWYMFQQLTMVVAVGRGTRIAGGIAESEDPSQSAENVTRAVMTAYGLDGEGATVEVSIDDTVDPQTITVVATLPFRPLIGLVPVLDEIGYAESGVYYGHLY